MTLILFGVLFLMLMLGVPISISLGIAVVCGIIKSGNLNLMPIVAQRMFTQLDNFTLMAVPLFILAGNIMEKGGISIRLIQFLSLLLRKINARLACITVVASAFFGAISGSNPATVAAIGGITYPHMRDKGYPPDVAAAVAASSGTLGVVIPPSIPMVTYAVTASVSIGTMFMAGVVPGVLLAVALVTANVLVNKKYDAKDTRRVPAREYFLSFKDALLALIMPVIILGGIYGGFFTPTEAAAVACVYALIISCFVYKELTLKELWPIFLNSAISSAVVLFVVALSAPFAYFMTTKNIPTIIAQSVLSVFSSKVALVLMMNVILLFLGCFLETQSIILLVTPIFLTMIGPMGLTPVELGIIIIVNTSIGMITPPMGVNLFVACGIAKVSLEQVSRRLAPYLIAELIVLLVISYLPATISWLPGALGV